MEKLKSFLSLGAAFVVLLFLPEENRIFWFHTPPEAWYGQIRLEEGGVIYTFAKNASDTPVSAGLANVNSSLVRHFNRSATIRVENDPVVPPRSYTLIISNSVAGAQISRAVMDERIYFKPEGLKILTPAEEDVGFILIAALIVGFVVLAYFVAIYFLENERVQVRREIRRAKLTRV